MDEAIEKSIEIKSNRIMDLSAKSIKMNKRFFRFSNGISLSFKNDKNLSFKEAIKVLKNLETGGQNGSKK